MANNKKSFVLYCDLITTVNKLPNDKAGELFKIILEYVNDNNPNIDDLLLDVTFEPIKQQLKRDLLKYEEKREQWSNAGKQSAKKRKEKQRTLTDVKKRSTDSTVTVNDTVNVNDISYTDFLKNNHSAKFEQMRMKLRGINEKDFFEFFNNKCIIEDIPFEFNKINARFNLLKSNWNKDTKETPTVLKLKDVGL